MTDISATMTHTIVLPHDQLRQFVELMMFDGDRRTSFPIQGGGLNHDGDHIIKLDDDGLRRWHLIKHQLDT